MNNKEKKGIFIRLSAGTAYLCDWHSRFDVVGVRTALAIRT